MRASSFVTTEWEQFFFASLICYILPRSCRSYWLVLFNNFHKLRVHVFPQKLVFFPLDEQSCVPYCRAFHEWKKRAFN